MSLTWCLKHCSDINERNNKQLFFYFVIMVNISPALGKLSFPSVGQFSGRKNHVSHFYLAFSTWIPIRIWPRMYWFSGFSWWYMPRLVNFITVRIKNSKKCSVVFLWPQIVSTHSLGFLWAVFWICLCFLAIGFSNLVLWALAKQLNVLLLSQGVFQWIVHRQYWWNQP